MGRGAGKESGRHDRHVALAGAALAGLALLVSGCGGSKAPSVANLGTTTATASDTSRASTGAAGSGSTKAGAGVTNAALAYANCMRSSGVSNFPDPSASGGGFSFQAGTGINPASPTFQAAQAKCRELLPGGGPPAPGSSTHPSAEALAQMLKVAQCMRRHGVSGFPDPTTTVPARLGAPTGVISFRDGVILVFPATLDMQSPLFLHAAATCGFQLHNH